MNFIPLVGAILMLTAGAAQAAIVTYQFTSGSVALSSGAVVDGPSFTITIDTEKTIRTFYIEEGPYDAEPYTVDFENDGIMLEGSIQPGRSLLD